MKSANYKKYSERMAQFHGLVMHAFIFRRDCQDLWDELDEEDKKQWFTEHNKNHSDFTIHTKKEIACQLQ